MAKANLVLSNGTTVSIEGTADEVAILVGRISQPDLSRTSQNERKSSKKTRTTTSKAKRRKEGPKTFIQELVNEDYFKSQKRTIGDIKTKLEERGHIYALTNLSTPLIRLTKERALRRLKENGVWVYVT